MPGILLPDQLWYSGDFETEAGAFRQFQQAFSGQIGAMIWHDLSGRGHKRLKIRPLQRLFYYLRLLFVCKVISES